MIINWLKFHSGRLIGYGLSIVILSAVINAAFFYYTTDYDYTHIAKTDATATKDIDVGVAIPDKKPTPLITQIDEVKEEERKIKISFSALNVNATTKVQKFECSIDMGSWTQCESPMTLDTVNDNNTHTLEIRVIDSNNGTELSPLTHLFK